MTAIITKKRDLILNKNSGKYYQFLKQSWYIYRKFVTFLSERIVS